MRFVELLIPCLPVKMELHIPHFYGRSPQGTLWREILEFCDGVPARHRHRWGLQPQSFRDDSKKSPGKEESPAHQWMPSKRFFKRRGLKRVASAVTRQDLGQIVNTAPNVGVHEFTRSRSQFSCQLPAILSVENYWRIYVPALNTDLHRLRRNTRPRRAFVFEPPHESISRSNKRQTFSEGTFVGKTSRFIVWIPLSEALIPHITFYVFRLVGACIPSRAFDLLGETLFPTGTSSTTRGTLWTRLRSPRSPWLSFSACSACLSTGVL